MSLFHKHDFKEVMFIISETTCECGGWKMFHDADSPAGNCGNFRPMTDKKMVCTTCGYEKTDKQYFLDKQSRILGIK